MAHVKKGDKVIVLTGRDKGKTGEVLKVLDKQSRVLVSGVNIHARHTKASAQGSGGIKRTEASIHVSNVAHVDPKSGKAARVGVKVLKSGEKSLVARGSGEEIRRI
ncbi:MAG TPA: 50S ribosomal protein L24 [Alphaproteobacteria bacterium]|nr:50S ribosomal protein L24 [Alphaproteobacteria bacterium]